jgi:SSS family solute:Na+ symporter
MTLTYVDWAIVVAYFVLSAGIGLLFTKKGGESLSEYFLSGRNVPWWLAGASMVATTFAADSPLRHCAGFVHCISRCRSTSSSSAG